MLIFTLIVVIVIIFVVFYLVQSMVSRRIETETAFEDLEMQLDKRVEIIPNLVIFIQNYLEYDRPKSEEPSKCRGHMNELLKLKQQLDNPNISIEKMNELDRKLTAKLKTVMKDSEEYPELMSNSNMITLRSSLQNINEQIVEARETYNSTVSTYNMALNKPQNKLVSLFLNERPRTMFETP